MATVEHREFCAFSLLYSRHTKCSGMSEVEYFHFNRVNPEEFLEILNDDDLRTHLIDHPFFDSTSIKAWMNEKVRIDASQGCCVRAVYIGGVLAGWCGIQPDDKGFEIALVISKRFWGGGITIFRALMVWANDLGHTEILFHLLESRPVYKYLEKMSSKIQKTKLAGRSFTTYYIPVASQ